MTLTETMGATGDAPARSDAAPAAIPATNVPWPRWSSVDVLPAIVDTLTLAIRRLPKSERFWTPESTTAMAGVLPAYVERSPAQTAALPDSYGQSWDDESVDTLPATCMVESGVTMMPGTPCSFLSCEAGTVSATPLIRLSCLMSFWKTPRPVAFAFASARPPQLWMITSTLPLAFSKLGAMKLEAIGEVFAVAVFDFAIAARGAASTNANTHATTAPRPPLPQSTLERSPPRPPVPHKALLRSELAPRSFN